MKQKMIEIWNSLLAVFMNQCALISFAITVVGLFDEEKMYMLLWIGLSVIPIILLFARMHVQNFFLFFAVHLIFPVITVFLPVKLLIKVLMLALILVYIVWSVRMRIKMDAQQSGLFHPLFSLIVIGAMCLVENLASKRGWEIYYILMGLCYLTCYFIYYFGERYLSFIELNEKNVAKMPKKEIFLAGMKQTAVFTAGMLFVLILAVNIGLINEMLARAGDAILAFLRMIFAGASLSEEEDMEGLQEMLTAGISMQGSIGIPVEDKEPSAILLFLEKVVIIITPVIIVAMLVLVAIVIFRFFWTSFHMARLKEDKKLDNGIDIRETCVIENTKKEAVNPFAFLSNRQKVRKVFRKQILNNKTAIIGNYNLKELEYLTAMECCEKISADALKAVYEKARYSEEEITSEDVKLVKSSGK